MTWREATRVRMRLLRQKVEALSIESDINGG